MGVHQAFARCSAVLSAILLFGVGCTTAEQNPTGSTGVSSASSTGTGCGASCEVGVSECTDGGVRTCVAGGTCPTWTPAQPCATTEICDAGACVPKPPSCSGTVGSFHDQALDSGGETRHYFLHVPADYACTSSWPLLVDFHGTGFGSLTDHVEESWAFDEMIEASDTEHFIVVRPRSRPTSATGGYVYQWDLNPGDLELNHDFAVALVADLEARYQIDPNRVYALGFSNGPTMATHFLGDDPSIMHGYAAISGGLNEPIAQGPMLDGPNAPRVYEMTGFRDYMGSAQRMLDDHLISHGLPVDHQWKREADTGHELYGWHYHEAFRFMDKGVRNPKGSLDAAFTRDATFTGGDSLIQAAIDPKGSLNVVGTGGAIYAKSATGWAKTASLSAGGVALPLTDICFLPSGKGFASGDGWLATTNDGLAWTVSPHVPEFGSMQFGYTHVTTVGCSSTGLVAAGVWSAAESQDAGASWGATSFSDAPPFFTSMRRLASGTWLGVGYYDVLARSADGIAFQSMSPPVDAQWLNGIAVGPTGMAWVVGEKGTILRTTDDAQTFEAEPAPGHEDLYAVAFSQDGSTGLAVGAHGAAYASVDGGVTWTDHSTGLDGFLGDVVFVDDHTAWVVGADGFVAKTTL